MPDNEISCIALTYSNSIPASMEPKGKPNIPTLLETELTLAKYSFV